MAQLAQERTIRALVQFGIDPRGMREVMGGSSRLQASIKNLDKVIREMGDDTTALKTIFTTMASQLDMMSHENAPALAAALRSIWDEFEAGRISIDQVQGAINELEGEFAQIAIAEQLQDDIQKLRTQVYQAVEPFQDLAMVASQIEGVGFELQDMGRRITDPLRMWAEEYVRMAEGTTEVSQRWLETTEDLEAAQMRLGAVAAQSLLPLMELTAKVVERAADIAEQFPEITQIALGMGTILVAATALNSAVMRGIRLVNDAKTIAAWVGMLTSAKIHRDSAAVNMAAATTMAGAAKQNAAAAGMQAAGGRAGLLGMVGGLLPSAGGLAAAAASPVAIIAALVGVGVVAKKVGDQSKRHTAEMADHWDKFFDDQAKSTASATELANAYNAAQDRVSQAYDEGGVLASFLFDREKLVNASRQQVQTALIGVARSYEDYTTAIERLNEARGRDQESIEAVTRETFRYRQELIALRRAYQEGEASLHDYARAMLESNNFAEQIVGLYVEAGARVQDALATTRLLEPWEQYLDELAAAQETWRQAESDAVDEYDEASLLALEQHEADVETAEAEHQAAILQMELDFGTAREAIINRAGDDIVDAEETIATQRQQAMIDFQSDLASMEEDYYADRAEAAEEHGLEMARMEQDHQIQMRRMREDSERRQTDAVRARDAIRLLEEQRSYQLERGRAEEDYGIEAGRRNQDFARQMAQMEQAFQEQYAEREKAYREQLAALQAQQDDERRLREAARDEELEELEEQRQRDIRDLHDHNEERMDDLDEAYDNEKRELGSHLRYQLQNARNNYRAEKDAAQRSWDSRRQMLGVYLPGELREIRSHYEDRLSALRSWMARANAIIQQPSQVPGMQAGGYLGSGLYRAGEAGYEYLMDHGTTRMAERLAGGSLDARKLQGMMLAGAGGKTVNLSMPITIGGASDPEKTARLVRVEALKVIDHLLTRLQ